MIKTLTKHGNSWALVIDKPILDLLNIAPETPLEILTDGQTLIVSPARSANGKRNSKRLWRRRTANTAVHEEIGRIADAADLFDAR